MIVNVPTASVMQFYPELNHSVVSIGCSPLECCN